MTEESPWNSWDVRINFIAIVALWVFGTYMLAIKCWRPLLAFWVFWVLYFTIGRYMTCRHCDFLGRPCPSWNMGILAAKMGMKRSEKKNFYEDGNLKLILLDVLFMLLAIFIPYIKYIYDFFTIGVFAFDVVLLIIYTAIVGMVLLLHLQLGCKKCPMEGCLMNPKRKGEK